MIQSIQEDKRVGQYVDTVNPSLAQRWIEKFRVIVVVGGSEALHNSVDLVTLSWKPELGQKQPHCFINVHGSKVYFVTKAFQHCNVEVIFCADILSNRVLAEPRCRQQELSYRSRIIFQELVLEEEVKSFLRLLIKEYDRSLHAVFELVVNLYPCL